MIELIIQNPWISQNELAAHFGYTPGWVSQVIASDAFQEKMALRKSELIDPAIRATVEERFRALVIQSYEVLKRKLEVNPSDDLALGVMNGAARALGYGARPAATTQVNNSFVVQLPSKSESSEAWIKECAPTPLGAGAGPVLIGPTSFAPLMAQPSHPLLPKAQSEPIKDAEVVLGCALVQPRSGATPDALLAELMEK
jgi:hypothetical protein